MADLRDRRIRKGEPSDGFRDVGALLELAESHAQDGAVLVGIDVVLGVPAGYWRMVLDGCRVHPPETFVDWLGGLDVSGRFFETVVAPDCLARTSEEAPEPHQMRMFPNASSPAGKTSA